MTSSRCDLKVVLFCKGRGADAASYRPNRDESQWWSRRDALVRCVSSFLFGPSPISGDKELILLFDDDAARMEMKMIEKNDYCTIIPTEQTIVGLWKSAAQNLNQTVNADGIACCIHYDPTKAPQMEGGQSSSSASSIPTGLDSKRQILEFLQTQCSIDFLRDQGLNSNPDVILRKINKKRLLQVWSAWVSSKKYNGQSQTTSTSNATGSFFEQILPCPKHDDDGEKVQYVAGTLHEDCEEFPCFDMNTASQSAVSQQRPMKLFLFLGAVRDMTSAENSILQKTCKRLKIPLVGIRFGTTPEFTSKILTILSFHHAHNAISTPIQRLLQTSGTQSIIEQRQQQVTPSAPPSALHAVCVVPVQSSLISTDLKQRDRIHWCLVRTIVCTLWRSRLVSSNKTLPHTNSLHLVFDDGVVVHLYEDKFVANLANQHQAAPCEFQILTALQKEIEIATIPEGDVKKKKLAKDVLQTIMDKFPTHKPVAINVEKDSSSTMREEFYLKPSPSQSVTNAIILILGISPKISRDMQKRHKMQKAFPSALDKMKIPLLHQSVLSSKLCGDFEAATVTIMQHFCYQKRLFLPSETQQVVKSKRKHDAI